MAITQLGKRFHLTDGKQFSRVIALIPDGEGRTVAEELYLGKAIPDSAVEFLEDIASKTNSPYKPNEISLRTSAFLLCPNAGVGDPRPAALQVREEDGTWSTELNFVDAEILDGKPALEGLPSVYTEKGESETLVLRFVDAKTNLEVRLLQTVVAPYHALISSMIVENKGDTTLWLEKMSSATIHLHGDWDMLHLHGMWARERKTERIPSMHGVRSIGSNRGASGHEHSPFVALMSKEADEKQGIVCGVSLVYSGNFLIEADQDPMDGTRLVAGLAPCSWKLPAGAHFTTPEAVIAWSDEGLNGMSHVYHRLYRERLCRGTWRDKLRPVLCNNWEGTYFDFDEERILNIAKQAAELGTELFVLDDGWFGKRNNDKSSLGDWYVNYEKLPHGLDGLSDRVHEMGMMFGLWVEPEMVNPDSNLYRAHPDWCIHAPARERTTQRHQLVLDLSRTDVQDWLISIITGVLKEAKVDYVKWDMNRNFAQVGSAMLPPERQSELPHRYMLGLYRVMDEIIAALPDVLFESCASGGGRFDAGMLYYMPQTWTSDDTDAVERLSIQYGTSIVFPPSTMGAHVSAVPNEQVGRMATLQFRAAVALGGNMGYEMDLCKLTDAEKQEIRGQIERVKKVRHLTQRGQFTRLCGDNDDRIVAWQFSNDDLSEVIVCLFQRHAMPVPTMRYVPVLDIDDTAIYEDEDGKTWSGAVLKHMGLRVPFGQHGRREDHDSLVLYLKKKEA